MIPFHLWVHLSSMLMSSSRAAFAFFWIFMSFRVESITELWQTCAIEILANSVRFRIWKTCFRNNVCHTNQLMTTSWPSHAYLRYHYNLNLKLRRPIYYKCHSWERQRICRVNVYIYQINIMSLYESYVVLPASASSEKWFIKLARRREFDFVCRP